VDASPEVDIRAAQLADLPALNTLETESFPSDRLSPRQMRYLLSRAKAHTLVAVHAGEVVAYATLLLPTHPRPARLYSIAVRADVRGQGIAARLMTALMQIAKQGGYSRVRLEVRASAASTQALYRRFGFRQTRHLASYYGDGEDALRMEYRCSS
jgi:ribosomal-protein-alanine acetyltransferase